jgi:hypothetical protein
MTLRLQLLREGLWLIRDRKARDRRGFIRFHPALRFIDVNLGESECRVKTTSGHPASRWIMSWGSFESGVNRLRGIAVSDARIIWKGEDGSRQLDVVQTPLGIRVLTGGQKGASLTRRSERDFVLRFEPAAIERTPLPDLVIVAAVSPFLDLNRGRSEAPEEEPDPVDRAADEPGEDPPGE